jgi:hypothetical protein
MSSDADPAELEQQRQREADKLQRGSNELGQDVEEVSQDWDRKRSDEGVPGAQPHAGEDSGEDSGEEDSGDGDGNAEDEDGG